MKKVKVWDLQTRIFHWSLVASIFSSLITADILHLFGLALVNKDTWLSFHIGVGTAAGLLLTFRIFWGLCGPYYSRFTALRLSLPELCGYLDQVRKGGKTSYTGHNPAASWSVVCIIVFGLSVVLSGVVVYGLDEGRGLLRPLYANFHPLADELKLVHLGLAFTLLAVIIGHISGALHETILHRTGIIPAMFTGKKDSAEAEIPMNTSMPLTVVAFAWVLSPIVAVLYLSSPESTAPPSDQIIPAIYKKECAACHMAFPANALPASSWRAIMASLQDHFGEDATLDEAATKEIEGFLVANAAEHSLEEVSRKFIHSIGQGEPPLRITDIPYWQEKHKPIPPATFRREAIKARSNCVACHKWSEYGSFEDRDIRIPSEL